jgi:hypothetical protein
LARHFEPNLGQTDASVRYLSRGDRYTLFLMQSGEAVLKLVGNSGRVESLRVAFLGAAPAPAVAAKGHLAGKSAYFVGNDPRRWRTGVSHYRSVEYKDLYPGIDLVYYGNPDRLEYDLRVAPGADASRIVLVFEGNRGLTLDAEGNVVAELASGNILHRAPVVYQEDHGTRVPVKARYTLRGANRIGIELGEYDRKTALVIDPILTYSTFLGGSGNFLDEVNGLAVDNSGQAYVVGGTASSDFPASGALNGTQDVFVAKLDKGARNLLYSVFLGGGGVDTGLAIAIDSTGGAYITGSTDSTDFPAAAGFQTSKSGTGTDAFVARVDGAGTLQYGSYLGGNGNSDAGRAIALEGFDAELGPRNFYVAGQTNSANFPTTVGAYRTTRPGGNDAFVTRVDSATFGVASLLSSTYLGGTGGDVARAVAVDGGGNVQVAGETASAAFPLGAAPIDAAYDAQLNNGAAGTDAFLAKLDSGLSTLSYSTFLGGTGTDRARAISIGVAGLSYLAGETNSTDFPTAGAFDASANGNDDAYVTAIDTTAGAAGLAFSTYLGGTAADNARALEVSGSLVYVAGQTSSNDYPTTVNALQSKRAGGDDAFVTKLDTNTASLGYSTYLGGSVSDVINGLAVDTGTGAVFVAGHTASASFPATVKGRGDPIGASGGDAAGADGFVAKILDVEPKLDVFNPHTGFTWAVGSTQQIKWTHNLGKYTTIRLEKSENGGPFTLLAAASAVSNQTNAINGNFNSSAFKWKVTASAARPFPATIRAVWNQNGALTSISDTFTIANPAITVTQPTQLSVFQFGEVRQIDWTDNLGGTDVVSIGVMQDGPDAGTALDNLCRYIGDQAVGTNGGFTWTVAAPAVAGPARMCVRFPVTTGNWVPTGSSQTTGLSAIFSIIP